VTAVEPAFDPGSVGDAFGQRYGVTPAVLVRAPGRVNVIGEHTDYSNLPVMPMAIQRSLQVAAGPAADGRITAYSTEFGACELMVSDAETEPQGWARYLWAAAAEQPPADGVRLLVSGDLPVESGLSSSAALVTGVLAAIAAVAGDELEPAELIRRAIAAEQRVGVRSGGMDQTIVVCGRAGALLRIDFDPPATRSVTMPEGLAIVLAFSCERAAKAGGARRQYNTLVTAARLAAMMLSRALGIDDQRHLASLRGRPGLQAAVDDLPEHASIADVMGASTATARLAPDVAVTEPLPVGAAARHAFTEADRVNEVEPALLRGDLRRFGAALSASHQSLSIELDCSTPALDALCSAMLDAGALGARLTGAGFGGYALAAVEQSAAARVLAAAIEATGGPAFVAEPSQGLTVT
jgi:galactokinase